MSSFNYRELEEREKAVGGTDHVYGMTLMTLAKYISSSRSNMVTSHLKQFVPLNNPDFPKLSTGYENTVGKNSTGYYKAKHQYEVVAKIPRFKNGIDDDNLYFLFVYDRKNDYYDIIQKKVVEDLTEKFGYAYKTDVIDSKEVGDIIEEGEVLYRSTSYDEDMNYGFGKNVLVLYGLPTETIEDCIIARKGVCKEFTSKEVELVKVSLNDNDILCNIYGDNDEYKAFPDIGELINNKIVACKRRIHNSQVLYDLKKSNLKKINYDNDTIFYNEGRIVDIYIRSNKPLDEIEDNVFNRQLKKYLTMQTEFYQAVYDECDRIINSGSNFSKEISHYYKRSRDILDPNVKWREENNAIFNNMIVEFLVERNAELTVGQKITGRKHTCAIYQ